MTSTKDHHIVVIGAGVTGLTTAVLLAEAGYKVSIIAAHVPGDTSLEYTSPWGGAQWRTHASSSEPMSDWDMQTYDYWLELLKREENEPGLMRSGVKMYDSLLYWDAASISEDLWWTSQVQNYRMLPQNDEHLQSIAAKTPQHAPSISHAAFYRAMTVNVNQYLPYLLHRAEALGATLIKTRLPTNAGLEPALAAAEAALPGLKPACFINATGIGAASLCADKDVYPIRGQTVLVKGEGQAIRTRIGDGYISYCVPRAGSGMSILGGTKQAGNWSGEVDDATTKEILDRCAVLLPELLTGPEGRFEVVSVQCGLRPGRTGGPRVERERVGGREVVHAYGHAGAGYQNSIGSARAVVKLVEEGLVGQQ